MRASHGDSCGGAQRRAGGPAGAADLSAEQLCGAGREGVRPDLHGRGVPWLHFIMSFLKSIASGLLIFPSTFIPITLQPNSQTKARQRKPKPKA